MDLKRPPANSAQPYLQLLSWRWRFMIQQSLADAIIELGNGKGFQITGNTYDDFVVTSAIEGE